MDEDFLSVASTSESLSNLTNSRNGELNDVSVNAIVQSNNEILLSAVVEHMENNSIYFNNQLLSDCLLKVGTKTFHAHKFLLAKSSDVFQTMFYMKHWSSSSSPSSASASTSKSLSAIDETAVQSDTITAEMTLNSSNIDQYELVETEECAEVFEKFLKFFYVAEILISNDEVIGLLYLADKYNVLSLRNVASQYMIIQAKSPNVKNAIDWYRIAKDFKQNDLKDVCLKTIAWNAEYLLNSDDWLNTDLDFLKDLLTLQASEIVVASEFTFYNAISKWLLYDNDTVALMRRKENFKQHCSELIPFIRFSQMLDTDLYEIEKSELAENYASADIIKQQLYKAYRFRVLEELLLKTANNSANGGSSSMATNWLDNERGANSDAFTNLTEFDKSNDIEFYDPWYLPRDYTEMNLVDIVEIKNTLRVGIQVDVKTCKGVAPKKEKQIEWKVLYRVSNANINRWTLRITCNPIVNECLTTCKAKISLIVYNNEHLVLQVERGRTFTFNGTNCFDIELNLVNPNETKELYLLIKPVLF